MKNLKSILSKFNNKRILVIGDLILDQYIQGSVTRISPEAPVPIVLQEKAFFTPGGSANVANNLSALGAKVSILGKIGTDQEGQVLKRELKKKGVDISSVFTDRKLPTVTKTRILAQNQQIVRIDRESARDSGDPAINSQILKYIEKNINSYDAIIISDYGKGLITRNLVELTCSLAARKNKVITVDPKVEHFSYYRKVTSITPNKKEAENAIRDIKIRQNDGNRLGVTSDKLETMDDIQKAGEEILKYLELDSLLMTLGEHGMCLFENGKKPITIATKAQEVFDVTGAGDTVISVFTLSLTAGASKLQAAELANFAAGVVVGKLGAATLSKEELLIAIKGER